MARTTTAQIEAQIDEINNAITAVINSKAYAIGGRSLTRQDLQSLLDARNILEADLARNVRGGIKVRGITPS